MHASECNHSFKTQQAKHNESLGGHPQWSPFQDQPWCWLHASTKGYVMQGSRHQQQHVSFTRSVSHLTVALLLDVSRRAQLLTGAALVHTAAMLIHGAPCW